MVRKTQNPLQQNKKNAAWQLPKGVSCGTWDYCHSDDMARSYDAYFGEHGLFHLDQAIIQRHTQPGHCVVDLGCGTGRAILPLLARGIACVAFDLSQPMLKEVQEKAASVSAETECGPLMCVRGNLVELGCFADQSFDAALCLFSTLGMVRGNASRQQVVQHVARTLKPGGRFILHVHNYWVQIFDPHGPRRMLRNAWHSMTRQTIELGDHVYAYRGIPDMYLHSFSGRRLQQLLRGSGFRIREWIPLNAHQDGCLGLPRLVSGLRASGWIVVAEKKT